MWFGRIDTVGLLGYREHGPRTAAGGTRGWPASSRPTWYDKVGRGLMRAVKRPFAPSSSPRQLRLPTCRYVRQGEPEQRECAVIVKILEVWFLISVPIGMAI